MQTQAINFVKELFEKIEDFSEDMVNRCTLCSYDGDDFYGPAIEAIGASGYSKGASKLVLYFEELPNHVVKIPFVGSAKDYCPSDNNEDDFVEMRYKYGDNYCEIEAYQYDSAVRCGVADFFFETCYVGAANGIELYVMEKANSILGYNFHNPSEDSVNQVRKLGLDETSDVDRNTISLVVESFPKKTEEEFRKFASFLESQDIGDLHDDNWGWDEEGHLRLLDYSGYWE